MKTKWSIFCALILSLFSLPVWGCDPCLIRAVHDGDTVTAECADGIHKLRLLHIDAPELKQPDGDQSRDYLSSEILNQKVEVCIEKKDLYGRDLAALYIEDPLKGKIDVNLLMVRSGHAWSYKHDDLQFMESEGMARSEKIGLWAGDLPEAPWEYRKRIKEEQHEHKLKALEGQ